MTNEQPAEPEGEAIRGLPLLVMLLKVLGLLLLIPVLQLALIAIPVYVMLSASWLPWHERVAGDYRAHLNLESIPHLASLSELGICEVSMGPGMVALLDQVDRSMVGISMSGSAFFNASPNIDVLSEFSRLRSLSLGPHVDSDLSRLLPRLRKLPLEELRIEGDELLQTLGRCESTILLPKLRSLELVSSDQTAISTALSAFSQLRLRFLTISSASEDSPPLPVVPKIRDVPSVRISGFRVEAKTVRGILSRSTTRLDLDQCPALTELDAIELAGLCSMGHLTLKLPKHVDQLYVREHVEWRFNPRSLRIESKFLYPPPSQQTWVRR